MFFQLIISVFGNIFGINLVLKTSPYSCQIYISKPLFHSLFSNYTLLLQFFPTHCWLWTPLNLSKHIYRSMFFSVYISSIKQLTPTLLKKDLHYLLLQPFNTFLSLAFCVVIWNYLENFNPKLILCLSWGSATFRFTFCSSLHDLIILFQIPAYFK